MYDELYEAWTKEKGSTEIQRLPRDFFAKLASYMKRIREEGRMLDQKTTRARLLQREFKNVKKLVKDLVQLRYKKTFPTMLFLKIVPSDVLTEEEERLNRDILPSIEAYHVLLKELLRGRLPHIEREEKPKEMVVRILREVPAIIGSDMKAYGPFKPEDIATLPAENAKILIKQGVAVEVEAKL